MSFAFMPMYTGDYHRDTRHLTPEEHGIYLLLLIYCWDQKGPVPEDERRQCGIVNARSGGEIESLRRVLREFFTLMEDGWYNKRMSEEVAKAEAISGHRRAGALEKARRQRDKLRDVLNQMVIGPAQAQHEHSTSNASAGTPTPTPTLTPTPTPTPRKPTPSASPNGAAGRGTRLSQDFQLPDGWKQWAIDAYHLDPQKVIRVSLAFKDYWLSKPGSAGRKADWQATWRNWVRKECDHA